MIRNYFKIAWRNLIKNRGFSVINILGLAVGMTFALVIGLWVKYEMSFDDFHARKKQIAVVMQNSLFNDEKWTLPNVPLPLYDLLKAEFPEINHIARTDFGMKHNLRVGETTFSFMGYYIDPDFLEIFSFSIAEGDVRSALASPNSILLSRSVANALFGEDDAIGSTVRLDNQHDVFVSGIFEDIPSNSSYQFDFLAPYQFLINTNEFVKNNVSEWSNNFISIVVELEENVTMEEFSSKIEFIAQQRGDNKYAGTLFLHPLEKLHLYDQFREWKTAGGKIEYVQLFSLIGFVVLLIACINFMNLSTARSEKRAKEVGIRKAIGSKRTQVIKQFLFESSILSLVAFLFSLAFFYLALPFLADLGFENISFDATNLSLLLILFAASIITGLVAGSYPAFYLSSFVPVKVLKSQVGLGKNAGAPRKILVTLQFTFSIALIICTVVIFRQIQHGKDRPLGYNPNNLLSMPANSDLQKNYSVLKEDLMNCGDVEAVSYASTPLTNVYDIWGNFSWTGKAPDDKTVFGAIVAGYDFDRMAGLKLIDGRFFSESYSMNSEAIVLNESAVNVMGYQNPLGQQMKVGSQDFLIIGVVEDLVMLNTFGTVLPTAIIFNSDNNELMRTIGIRLKNGVDIEKALARVEQIVEKHNPSFPFEYSFVDQQVEEKLAIEKRAGKIAGLFACLSIFISCLGLFGLAAYLAESRIKEIGIRKVMGATLPNLWALLSKDFLFLILIACLVASPLAMWLMQNWLEKYDYRIEVTLWVPLVASGLAISIVILTVSVHALRAAMANPMVRLKCE